MADSPFYTPNRISAVRTSRPGELLWTEWRDGIEWSATLRDNGEFGVEAQVLRDGELRVGQRFPTRESAMRWAENRRAVLNRRT
jgi:hypothetical protein